MNKKLNIFVLFFVTLFGLSLTIYSLNHISNLRTRAQSPKAGSVVIPQNPPAESKKDSIQLQTFPFITLTPTPTPIPTPAPPTPKIPDKTTNDPGAQATVINANGDSNVPACTPKGSPDAEAKWQQVLQFGQKYGQVWIEFLNAARVIAQQEDYPVAVIIGQGAHESARGTSRISRSKKNFFGFMAYDSNTNAARTYSTAADSIKDYVKLIKKGNGGKNKKYMEAYANRSDTAKMIQLIKAGGYATDPSYVSKVTGIREFKILAGTSLPCAL